MFVLALLRRTSVHGLTPQRLIFEPDVPREDAKNNAQDRKITAQILTRHPLGSRIARLGREMESACWFGLQRNTYSRIICNRRKSRGTCKVPRSAPYPELTWQATGESPIKIPFSILLPCGRNSPAVNADGSKRADGGLLCFRAQREH